MRVSDAEFGELIQMDTEHVRRTPAVPGDCCVITAMLWDFSRDINFGIILAVSGSTHVDHCNGLVVNAALFGDRIIRNVYVYKIDF